MAERGEPGNAGRADRRAGRRSSPTAQKNSPTATYTRGFRIGLKIVRRAFGLAETSKSIDPRTVGWSTSWLDKYILEPTSHTLFFRYNDPWPWDEDWNEVQHDEENEF